VGLFSRKPKIVKGYAIHPGADLTEANLSDANLTGAKLTDVVWKRTTCPDGTITDTGCS